MNVDYDEAFLLLVRARTEKLLADNTIEPGGDFWVGVELGSAIALRLAQHVNLTDLP